MSNNILVVEMLEWQEKKTGLGPQASCILLVTPLSNAMCCFMLELNICIHIGKSRQVIRINGYIRQSICAQADLFADRKFAVDQAG